MLEALLGSNQDNVKTLQQAARARKAARDRAVGSATASVDRNIEPPEPTTQEPRKKFLARRRRSRRKPTAAQRRRAVMTTRPESPETAAVRAGAFAKGSTVMGTPLSMAPEQVRGEPEERSNPKVGNVPNAADPKSAKWLARVSRRQAVTCKDAAGKTYTTIRGCAKGHTQQATAPQPSDIPRYLRSFGSRLKKIR